MIKQAFGEEIVSLTGLFEWKFHPHQNRNGEKGKVNKLITFFDSSLRIDPGRPNSHFRMLLWLLTLIASKYVKTSLGTLATEPAAASRQSIILHFLL